MIWKFVIIFLTMLGRAIGEDFPAIPLTEAQKASIYAQAKVTPGARQMGLACAFYANAPLLTMVSGINIADGSIASREFVSLRVLGEFGGPHNVLLLAHRSGKFYHHEPRTGRIVQSTSGELASRILTVSKSRSKLKKRYFSSYHLAALPAPAEPSAEFKTPIDFPKQLAIELTTKQESLIAANLTRADEGKGVTPSFPKIDFATKGKGNVSHIDKDLDVPALYGVYSISKIALISHHSGKRDSLPVWLMDGVPLALIGYAQGSETRLTFFDGKNRNDMLLADALGKFKKSGCYLGYLVLPQG